MKCLRDVKIRSTKLLVTWCIIVYITVTDSNNLSTLQVSVTLLEAPESDVHCKSYWRDQNEVITDKWMGYMYRCTREYENIFILGPVPVGILSTHGIGPISERDPYGTLVSGTVVTTGTPRMWEKPSGLGFHWRCRSINEGSSVNRRSKSLPTVSSTMSKGWLWVFKLTCSRNM